MKKIFTTSWLILFLFVSLMLPGRAFAAGPDTPDISVFNGQKNCDTSNPQSCDCLFVIRDNETNNLFFAKGAQNPNNSETVIIPHGKNYSFAVFVNAPSSNFPNNCFYVHNESNNINKLEAGTYAAVGCGVGALVPGANIITCPVGALVGLAGSGEILNFFNLVVQGEWDSHYRTVDKCNWEGTYHIGNWEKYYHYKNKVTVLTRKGNRGWGAQDDNYCNLVTSSQEIEGDDPNFESANNIDFDLCRQITDTDLQNKCIECQTPNENNFTGVWTAVGCIRTDPENIVKAILEVGISVSGGVALLMILAASFMLSTSKGDPKKTGEAKELITSAVIGLLFIIFSVSILQFIGVQILRIPGFGG